LGNIRNIQSILPTADADFLTHVLNIFLASESLVGVNEGVLDKKVVFPQIKGKLYKKGIAYKVGELITIDAALSLYLATVADIEGKRDIAERIKAVMEKSLANFLE